MEARLRLAYGRGNKRYGMRRSGGLRQHVQRQERSWSPPAPPRRYRRQKVQIYDPSAASARRTKSSSQADAHPVAQREVLGDLGVMDEDDTEVVGIDEGQFFDADLRPYPTPTNHGERVARTRPGLSRQAVSADAAAAGDSRFHRRVSAVCVQEIPGPPARPQRQGLLLEHGRLQRGVCGTSTRSTWGAGGVRYAGARQAALDRPTARSCSSRYRVPRAKTCHGLGLRTSRGGATTRCSCGDAPAGFAGPLRCTRSVGTGAAGHVQAVPRVARLAPLRRGDGAGLPVLPLSLRLQRGFSGQGIQFDRGFARWENVKGLTWRREGPPVLVVAHVRGGTAGLTMAARAAGAARRVLRDRLATHKDQIHARAR